MPWKSLATMALSTGPPFPTFTLSSPPLSKNIPYQLLSSCSCWNVRIYTMKQRMRYKKWDWKKTGRQLSICALLQKPQRLSRVVRRLPLLHCMGVINKKSVSTRLIKWLSINMGDSQDNKSDNTIPPVMADIILSALRCVWGVPSLCHLFQLTAIMMLIFNVSCKKKVLLVEHTGGGKVIPSPWLWPTLEATSFESMVVDLESIKWVALLVQPMLPSSWSCSVKDTVGRWLSCW